MNHGIHGDRYQSYSELSRSCTEGVDFRVFTLPRSHAEILVAAPHGGAIEPGTSEIASQVAGAEHSLYLFEGLRCAANGELHITSSQFNEPRALDMALKVRTVLTIHGCRDLGPVAYLGGLDRNLRDRVANELRAVGVFTQSAGHRFRAESRTNICNRGALGAGVQIELSKELRAPKSVSVIAFAIRSALHASFTSV